MNSPGDKGYEMKRLMGSDEDKGGPERSYEQVPTKSSNAGALREPDIEIGTISMEKKLTNLSLVDMPRRASHGRVISVSRAPSQILTVKDLAREGSPINESVDDHFLTLPLLSKKYMVPIDENDPNKSMGLTDSEAERRLNVEGLNMMSPPKEPNIFIQYFSLLAEPLTMMLLAAAFISIISKAFSPGDDFTEVYLGCLLLFVIFANTTVDFVQVRKSAALVKSLGALAPSKALTIRNGAVVEVAASRLARGDIIMLRSGDKIPADVRIIKATEMTVDNSQITGEGEPQKRSVFTDQNAALEAENLAFMGTTVVAGAGCAIVIKRGNDTVLGQISALAGETKDDIQSPLTKEIKAFVLLMGGGAFVVAVILLLIAIFLRGSNFVTSLSIAIGIFVAFALCGMPATITMLLTHASKELSKKNVLVKNLHAMDTLGAITLLCSDKTGTLTMNLMTVVEVWRYGLKDGMNIIRDIYSDHLRLCMALCNSASFVKTAENMALPPNERKVVGDATETAMLKYVSNDEDVDQLRAKYPPALVVPFSSENKWAAGVFQKSDKSYVVYLKGAPERVFRRCNRYKKYSAADELVLPLDDGIKVSFMESYERMAGKGQRVIACAMLDLSSAEYPPDSQFESSSFPSENMIFLGLAALQDPPKPGVTEAIDECNTAGIQVMMITGDHPLTAEAIAREIHIIRGKTKNDIAKERGIEVESVKPEEYDAVVLHGETLATMSEFEWAEALSKKEVVFARTSPQQKLEIVTRSQTLGHVVAMMGDGVNDSPALRRADMGIAMAITGSEVSREAASLVLLDDDFTSVIVGIKWGRIIFSNMKKAVCYTLGHIMGEIFPALLFIFLGLPLGISSFLIICIDLGTDISVVTTFAYEPADPDVMLRPPRRALVPKDVLIDQTEERQLRQLTNIDIAEAEEEEIAAEREAEMNFFEKVATNLYKWALACSTGTKEKFIEKGNPGDVKLVDRPTIIFAFLQNGFFAVATGLVTYFVVFNYYHFSPNKLFDAVPDHLTGHEDEPYTNNSGDDVDGKRQEEILHSVQSTYYFTISIMQFFAAFILKATDPCNLFSPAAFQNKTTYLAMFVSVGIAFFVTHTPGIQLVLGSNYFPLWSLGIPVAGGFVHLTYESVKRIVTCRRRA